MNEQSRLSVIPYDFNTSYNRLQVKLEEEKKKKEAAGDDGKDVKGIPEFWLTTFKNVEMVQEMIMEHDEPILEKLTDVSVTFSEKPMVSLFSWKVL